MSIYFGVWPPAENLCSKWLWNSWQQEMVNYFFSSPYTQLFKNSIGSWSWKVHLLMEIEIFLRLLTEFLVVQKLCRVVPQFYLYVWSVKMLCHGNLSWGWMFHTTLLAKPFILGLSWFLQSCKEPTGELPPAAQCALFYCSLFSPTSFWIRFHHWELRRILLNDFDDSRASIGWWFPLSLMEGQKPRSHRWCL